MLPAKSFELLGSSPLFVFFYLLLHYSVVILHCVDLWLTGLFLTSNKIPFDRLINFLCLGHFTTLFFNFPVRACTGILVGALAFGGRIFVKPIDLICTAFYTWHSSVRRSGGPWHVLTMITQFVRRAIRYDNEIYLFMTYFYAPVFTTCVCSVHNLTPEKRDNNYSPHPPTPTSCLRNNIQLITGISPCCGCL